MIAFMTMTRTVPAALATALLIAPNASAVSAPAVETRPGSAPTEKNFTCVPVKGNPELERAQHETPPPTGPEGQPTPPASGNSGACPAGTVGVSKPTPGSKHRPSNAAAPSTALAASEGYFYVGDIWESPKPLWVGAVGSTEFSGPDIPAGAAGGAHSIMQIAIAGGAICEGSSPQFTIEIGWLRERIDVVEGWHGSRLFFFVNPDCYGPRSCYNCGLVLASGEPTSPFNRHYVPTDGSPYSQNIDGTIKPYRQLVQIGAREYKGAWWLWFGNKWVGRVSNKAWATPAHPNGAFKASKEVQMYGEVFDLNPPLSQMGNGNKGGCLCATEMRSPQLAKKPIYATEEPVWSAPVALHNPLANVNYPVRYTPGNAGTTTVHLGG